MAPAEMMTTVMMRWKVAKQEMKEGIHRCGRGEMEV